jgi:CheY-like chemotaxis protein
MCVICDLPVQRDQMEFEIQFARDGENPGLDKFHVHIRCFAAWEFERRRPARWGALSSALNETGVTPGGRARVLIADDDSRLLQLLHDFLSGQGYEVAALATGIQVLDTLPAFQPDVIVVDMEMPGLSGPEVLAAVRRAGLTVPVILISGHQIIARDGFFAVLGKPFHFRRLADVVTAAVDHGRTFNG